ncbi:helix-turn-helix domain-containing protein [Haloarchaeobius sp. HRN-SO-5]|uniref:helix-turn-helix domain-containing protein n=1 Tax=Haloarchaeobius sp. HRN-SO-5 TaxID=3446118 RepID=UPI003EB6BAAF
MFVRYHIDSTLLGHAASSAPEMQVTIEQIDSTPSVSLRLVFWARGSAFDAFETGLEADPTVADATVLVDDRSRKLYRVVCSPGTPITEVYERSVELDGVMLEATSDGVGWTLKMLFPDRDAFGAFRRACEDAGLSTTVESIHSGDVDRSSADAGLTGAQREILSRAVEVGYFDIPRQTTLRGLGEEVGVSGQAASERLRRGMETLVRETLSKDLDLEE